MGGATCFRRRLSNGREEISFGMIGPTPGFLQKYNQILEWVAG